MPDLKVGPHTRVCTLSEMQHICSPGRDERLRLGEQGEEEEEEEGKMRVSICLWIWGVHRPLHPPLEEKEVSGTYH